jgi:hypothetical protein
MITLIASLIALMGGWSKRASVRLGRHPISELSNESRTLEAQLVDHFHVVINITRPLWPWRPASKTATTAACFTGELRTFVDKRVQDRLKVTVVDEATDAFFITAPTLSTFRHHYSSTSRDAGRGRIYDSSTSNPTAGAAIHSAMLSLRPVATLVADDDDLFGSPQSHCNALQITCRIPGQPSAVCEGTRVTDALARVTDALTNRSLADEIGACHTGFIISTRLRACLVMIEQAEDERGQRAGPQQGGGAPQQGQSSEASPPDVPLKYSWVVRLRPDLYLPCRLLPRLDTHAALSSSAPVSSAPWYVYSNDFMGWMPREVASVALRVMPLRIQNAYCLDAHQRLEWVHPCIMSQYASHVTLLDFNEWIPIVRSAGWQQHDGQGVDIEKLNFTQGPDAVCSVKNTSSFWVLKGPQHPKYTSFFAYCERPSGPTMNDSVLKLIPTMMS